MTPDELTNDETFWNWANGDNEEDCKKWERFFKDNPKHADVILRAKIMALDEAVFVDHPGDVGRDEEWNKLKSTVSLQERRARKRQFLRIAATAACFLLVLATGLYIIQPSSTEPVLASLQTEPGEVVNLTLDDGTQVTLNGNSAISYPEQFISGEARVVTLHGEAYFDVAHLDGDAFVVETDDAQTTVLGTKFNIKSRSEDASVISLLEGKVEINGIKRQKPVELSPGETAIVLEDRITVSPDNVNARVSWRNYLWEFSETPLRDILEDLEVTFGVNSTVKGNVVLDKAITGKLSTKNLGTLYNALEAMLGVNIKTTGDNHIIIERQ